MTDILSEIEEPDWKRVWSLIASAHIDLSDFSDEYVLGFAAAIEVLEPHRRIVRYVAGWRDSCCGSVASYELDHGCIHDQARAVLDHG